MCFPSRGRSSLPPPPFSFPSFLLLLLLLLLIGLAPRNRRCPVICLDHQIKPSVSSSFSRGVTSLPTICLLTKRRRRRPPLCLSTASLHILLARSGGFEADQVAHLIFVSFLLLLLFLCRFRAPPPLPPPSSSWKIVRKFNFSFFLGYLLSFQRSPQDAAFDAAVCYEEGERAAAVVVSATAVCAVAQIIGGGFSAGGR